MELTKIFKKDRSSIQRALQTLIEINVVERKSMSLKEFSEKKDREDKTKRGYLYVYGAKDLEMIKKQTRDLLDRWYASMQNYIENIDSVFDCYEKQGEL
jgi:predicted transcriptional regulator